MTITVEKWIPFEEAEKLETKNIGSMGGFFKEGMRWPDYVEFYEGAPFAEHYEALRQECLAKGFKFTGEHHQDSGANGCPVFSDGKFGTWTMRAWGDFMAAVWSTHEDKNYHYMDFYM